MNRFFSIYHNLVPNAPWGVAVERDQDAPKIELLLLCRTETEADQLANLTSLGDRVRELSNPRNPEPLKG